jgi:hypothetical protein
MAIGIHAVIFCWPRKVQDALRICESAAQRADKVTVIDASTEPVEYQGNWDWIKIDPACYFGHKFAHALRVFQGDVLLQIQADASHTDWGAVVELCRLRFAEISSLGIWSPEIDFTTWPTSRVKLYDTDSRQLLGVVQTDCIVWAMRKEVVEYLRHFDYTANNLGWGIDWAAIGHCYANKAFVLRDSATNIVHPEGTGYNQTEAVQQMAGFLRQLAHPERIQCKLLSGYIRYDLPV